MFFTRPDSNVECNHILNNSGIFVCWSTDCESYRYLSSFHDFDLYLALCSFIFAFALLSPFVQISSLFLSRLFFTPYPLIFFWPFFSFSFYCNFHIDPLSSSQQWQGFTLHSMPYILLVTSSCVLFWTFEHPFSAVPSMWTPLTVWDMGVKMGESVNGNKIPNIITTTSVPCFWATRTLPCVFCNRIISFLHLDYLHTNPNWLFFAMAWG